jgi:hypothetical protein
VPRKAVPATRRNRRMFDCVMRAKRQLYHYGDCPRAHHPSCQCTMPVPREVTDVMGTVRRGALRRRAVDNQRRAVTTRKARGARLYGAPLGSGSTETRSLEADSKNRLLAAAFRPSLLPPPVAPHNP